MIVQVKLFAVLSERAGSDQLDVELEEGATVRDAMEAISRNAGMRELIDKLKIVVAVNREHAHLDVALKEGDEVALIPPVSGGAGPIYVMDRPLSIERLIDEVARPGAGAIVTFQGTPRDIDSIDYEAYREMAEERIAMIVAEAIERHGLQAAAAEHRVGNVPLGEPSVAVATSSAHRDAAFAGAREIIDRIKAEAPIWKKELEGTSGRWVEGQEIAEPRSKRGF